MKISFPIATKEDRAEYIKGILSTGVASFFTLEGTNYTVAVIHFADGWSESGQSVCVNPADFNQELGESLSKAAAMKNAEAHYWPTIGYMAMIGLTEISYEPKV